MRYLVGKLRQPCRGMGGETGSICGTWHKGLALTLVLLFEAFY